MEEEKDNPDFCGLKGPQVVFYKGRILNTLQGTDFEYFTKDGFLQDNLSYLGGHFISLSLSLSLTCGRFVE